MKESKKVHFEHKNNLSINTRMANLKVKKSIHDFPVYTSILKRDKVDLLVGTLDSLKLQQNAPKSRFDVRIIPESEKNQSHQAQPKNAELPPIREESNPNLLKAVRTERLVG